MANKYQKEASDLVAPTAEGDDPLDSRSNINYWWRWLKATRENRYAVRHRADSLEAWKEYEKDFDFQQNVVNTMGSDRFTIYPIYNASSQILESAFYARTPEVVSQREFEINDDVANTMSLISERLGRYQVRVSNFDEVMNACVGDFLHSAKATNQVIYEAEIINQTKRNPLQLMQQTVPGDGAIQSMQGMQPDSQGNLPTGQGEPQFTNEAGEIHTGEVQQDETGYFHETQEQLADPKTQKIYLAPLPFDEVLHTPNAKTNKDITEMAYFFSYTKDEAEKKFDAKIIADYPWKSGTPKPDKKTSELPGMDVESPDKYMDGWEIYCKQTKKVYWVSEDYRQDFLRPPTVDPYGLENFFPSPPFIIQNKPRKTLYPRPPYVFIRPTIDQLNLMYERVFGLIDSIRRRAIVDGDEDIVNLLNAGDQEFVSARSLKNIVEKGGLDKMIWYLPVQELVQAITELSQLEDRFKQNVSEWFGVPDILRGMSDPIEAMGTQQIKASAASDRFKKARKDVQRLARDSIEMMVDLALEVFSDEKIQDICGFNYMDPPDQQRFPQALDILRDDSERIIRIDIETDSMVFIDEDLRANRRNIAIKSALDGMGEIVPLFQQNPAMGAIALKAILLQLENNSEGKQFQDKIKALGAQLEEAANQPKAPPPPDPMIAIKQGELQLKGQEFQAQQQKDAQEFQLKMAAQRFDQNFKTQELGLKGQIEQNDMAIKSQDVEIKGLAVQTKAQAEDTKNQLHQVQTALQAKVDNTTLELEKFKLISDEKEKAIQQARLDKEQILETVRMVREHALEAKKIAMDSKAQADTTAASVKTQQVPTPQAPPITIHNHIPKAGNRIGKITNDASGNPQVEISDKNPGGVDNNNE